MKNDIPPCYDEFKQKCKSAGLRVTPQRAFIYAALCGDKSHPSAAAVYAKVVKQLPNISFDTVYRTLLSFVAAGLAKGIGGLKRFDSDAGTHHHLACTVCGEITDFGYLPYDDLPIPEPISRRYRITGKRVVLEHICKKCCQ